MKILFVAPLLSVGATSRLMSEIIPMINAYEGVEVDFLIGKCVKDTFMPIFDRANVKVHKLNHSTYSPLNIFKIAKYLDRYDVIHVNLFPSLYWTAIANLICRKPIVYTEHNTYNSRRNKWYLRIVEKWVYKQYSRIISISEATQANLKEWLKANSDDKRFVVINNGVNLESFKNPIRERIYPHTLIMVARFAPAKDQKTIIRAMTLLDNDVHLILVGDGEKLEECKAFAKELAVSERVHFVGMQSDVPSWIGKADIGIQSSHWEGFGLPVVEMMAGGLPVVASDVEGVRQIVEGAGILFPHGDYEKLADIVKRLLSDAEYYEQVKRRCLERCERYSIKSMVESYINVYKEILS
jgi:glycosyltransferase involved in cell wall biosynthesis